MLVVVAHFGWLLHSALLVLVAHFGWLHQSAPVMVVAHFGSVLLVDHFGWLPHSVLLVAQFGWLVCFDPPHAHGHCLIASHVLALCVTI